MHALLSRQCMRQAGALPTACHGYCSLSNFNNIIVSKHPNERCKSTHIPSGFAALPPVLPTKTFRSHLTIFSASCMVYNLIFFSKLLVTTEPQNTYPNEMIKNRKNVQFKTPIKLLQLPHLSIKMLTSGNYKWNQSYYSYIQRCG
jgi:hypothetical protein